MTRFRPCIDLHDGRVKQIVGSSLSDDGGGLKTNFVSEHGAAWYAARYAADGLTGGHVIQLGPGNEEAARQALAAYPGGLQLGGGIKRTNAARYLEAGASHVIVTSDLFDSAGHFLPERLAALVTEVGRERLVVDLSCRAQAAGWVVAMNRWQTLTDLVVTAETLRELAQSCAEFLVHAVDVEGKCEGIDAELTAFLGQHCPIPVTYAGGIHRLEVLQEIDQLSAGRVDATIGSALDLFGGTAVKYADCLAFNRRG
jgi:phosphoribosylformimino-5-aminoimidazole carboxamide ribotide isomerase